jgi:lipoyl(octanoyl) transferase
MRALCEYKNAQRKAGQENVDYLLLLQHQSVYTVGKGGSLEYLRFSSDPKTKNTIADHEVYRVERGGEVTWHGPGQLVAYPILDLNMYKKDLHWWVTACICLLNPLIQSRFASSMEESVIKTASSFGVVGTRSSVNTGVWVGENKLSAVGISATRWITYHGISINVSCDMKYFDNIIPCGITVSGKGVCRLNDLTEKYRSDQSSVVTSPNLRDTNLFVAAQCRYIAAFEEVFQVTCVHDTAEVLDNILSKYPALKSSVLPSLTI